MYLHEIVSEDSIPGLASRINRRTSFRRADRDSARAEGVAKAESKRVKSAWDRWIGGMGRQNAKNLKPEDIVRFFLSVNYGPSGVEVLSGLFPDVFGKWQDKLNEVFQEDRANTQSPDADNTFATDERPPQQPDVDVGKKIRSNIGNIIQDVVRTAIRRDPSAVGRLAKSKGSMSSSFAAAPTSQPAQRVRTPEIPRKHQQALQQLFNKVVRGESLDSQEQDTMRKLAPLLNISLDRTTR